MKNRLLVILIVLFLVILTSCTETTKSNGVENRAGIINDSTGAIENKTEQVVCEAPYIRHETSCCLDQNENKICDEDEVQNETSVNNTVSDEDLLEKAARKLGRLIEQGDAEELYDMLTPERQSYKTKQEFISLFPYVMYGRRIIYDSDYNIIELNSTYPNPFSAMKLDEVEVDNEDGFAYFDLTYNNGWESSSGTYYFKKVNSEWKFDGFSNLVYAGCFNDEDCYEKSDKLQADCEMTCEDKKGFPLKTEDQFSCVSDVCNCYCWDENTGRGSKIAPEWKNLH